MIPFNGDGEREQRYSGGYTTRTYGSHRGTGIDAMQLEFGADLRSRANLERTAADVARAIVVFAGEYLSLQTRPTKAASKFTNRISHASLLKSRPSIPNGADASSARLCAPRYRLGGKGVE